MKKTKKVLLASVLGATLLTTAACRPYDKPKFVEIEPNQTAFVIPMKDAKEQGKFESVDFLEEKQVAAKRIQIPRTWYKTGYGSFTGKYKDDVRVIVVDRAPETRQWADKDTTFVGESKDSIKFQQGISGTAQILEEDTAVFLYQYAGKSLQTVMDNEIRDKIGSVLLEKYSTMEIGEIRANKSEVINHVRKEVESYFKKRGITISNIGFVGDMKYLQADVQEAINKDFKAQQERKAQATKNKMNEEKAQSELEQAKKQAQALEALKEMRELDNQEKWIEKWDGKLPEVMSDSSTIMMPKSDK